MTSLCCRLLSNAFEELIAFQRALKDFVASVDATYAKQYEDFYIGLEGSFGSKHVSPRTLTACFLSCIVCVEGIVTKCETGDTQGLWVWRGWEFAVEELKPSRNCGVERDLGQGSGGTGQGAVVLL